MTSALVKKRVEQDKLTRAYRVANARALTEIREQFPAVAAFADWLATDPSPDDRGRAIRLISETLNPIDGISDPLWDEPETTFRALLRLTVHTRPTVTPAAHNRSVSMLDINIKISEPGDVVKVRELFAAFGAQFAAASASASVMTPEIAGTIAKLATEPQPEAKAQPEALAPTEAPTQPATRGRGRPRKDAQVETKEPAPEVKAEPEAAPAEQAAPEAPADITPEAAREACRAFAQKHGPMALKAVWAELGVSTFSDVPADRYPALVERLAKGV